MSPQINLNDQDWSYIFSKDMEPDIDINAERCSDQMFTRKEISHIYAHQNIEDGDTTSFELICKLKDDRHAYLWASHCTKDGWG